jgi:hypothetical protein
MKLLFYFPNENTVRNKGLSYTNLLEGCGFSGTETALLEMSKYLVDKGHSVQIYGVSDTYIDYGIQYISENQLSKVDLDVDWYSPIFFCNLPNQRRLLTMLKPSRTKVFVWFQCFIHNSFIEEIKQYFRTYGQYLSKYVAINYIDIIQLTNSWTIYNGLNEIFITPSIPDSTVKRGNWIFHPVYERGGSVAKSIFSKINKYNPIIANKLHLLSYYTPDKEKYTSTNTIINCGSKTKVEVRDMLLKSDYFIYPLVLESGSVHHDTFGTVMLEALACGVIVIVWDVACISSVYEEYVVKIPVPEHVKQVYNPLARFANCQWMLSEEAEELFIYKIIELESDLTKKESIRQRGVEWARTLTWESLGSQMEGHLQDKL